LEDSLFFSFYKLLSLPATKNWSVFLEAPNPKRDFANNLDLFAGIRILFTTFLILSKLLPKTSLRLRDCWF